MNKTWPQLIYTEKKTNGQGGYVVGIILIIMFLAWTTACIRKHSEFIILTKWHPPKPKTENVVIRDFLESLFQVRYYSVECLYRGATSSQGNFMDLRTD